MRLLATRLRRLPEPERWLQEEFMNENTMSFTEIVFDGPPPAYEFLWMAVMSIVPIVCTIIFINGWIRIRKFKDLRWHHKFLYLSILLITSTILLNISFKLQELLFFAGTNEWGAAQRSITLVNMSHSFWKLSIGIIVLSYCIGLVILLPKNIIRNTEAN